MSERLPDRDVNHHIPSTVDEMLFALLGFGLFGAPLPAISVRAPSFWFELFQEAARQTVLPMVLESSYAFSPSLRPPEAVIAPFRSLAISQTIKNERLLAAQDALLAAFTKKTIPCLILKGSSSAVVYPRPEQRVLGDIDLLVERAFLEEASSAMLALGYQRSPVNEAFHIGFHSPDAFVELHFEATEYPDSPAGAFLRSVMADAVREPRAITMNGHVFPALSLERQAVSLLIHMQHHMKGTGIGLRHLCDFAMFVDSVVPDVWHRDVAPVLRRGGLLRFAEALARSCVLYLGLPASRAPWCADVEAALARDLIMDFFDSGNFGHKQPNLRATAVLSADKAGTGAGGGMLRRTVANINHHARANYPLARRLPVLLPVFWVYLPIRYLVGTTKKQGQTGVCSTFLTARRRKKLFDRLRIFQEDNRG